MMIEHSRFKNMASVQKNHNMVFYYFLFLSSKGDSRQVIVSVHKLLQLFPKVCCRQECYAVTEVTTAVCGCCISVTVTCNVGHNSTWQSSDQHSNITGTIFSNNLLLAASILFSGNSFSKISHMFDIMPLTLPLPSDLLPVSVRILGLSNKGE